MALALTPGLLVILGFVPSLIWLWFYLKKDLHPEPKYLITRTLIVGLALAPLAALLQWLFSEAASQLVVGYVASASAVFFLWAAFIEEYVKYLAVKFVVLHNPEFDEPTDAMIYMIAASLGFAAIENILVLFQTVATGGGLDGAVQIWLLRFAGATLLHVISSAILGYFLGLAWFYNHHSRKLIAIGLTLATFSHFTFNILLLTADSRSGSVFTSSAALLILAVLVSFLFSRLKKRSQLIA